MHSYNATNTLWESGNASLSMRIVIRHIPATMDHIPTIIETDNFTEAIDTRIGNLSLQNYTMCYTPLHYYDNDVVNNLNWTNCSGYLADKGGSDLMVLAPDAQSDWTIHMRVANILVPAMWSLLIIIGILGNGLVICILIKHGDRTATTFYIINLAVADLAFMSIVVPFTVVQFAHAEWILGQGMCKLSSYTGQLNLHATCLTLTAMTVDRYFAIVHPLHSIKRRTPSVAVATSVGIWIASCLPGIPFALYTRLYTKKEGTESRTYCRGMWPSINAYKVSVVYDFIATYVIPLTIIIACYSLMLKDMWTRTQPGDMQDNRLQPRILYVQQKQCRRRRVSRMVAAVVCLFALFWLPVHVFLMCLALKSDFPRSPTLYYIKIFVHTLSYANSCVNPIVYAFMGDGFRRALRKCFRRFRVTPDTEAPRTERLFLDRTALLSSPPASAAVSNNAADSTL